jgi:hypothetical protein
VEEIDGIQLQRYIRDGNTLVNIYSVRLTFCALVETIQAQLTSTRDKNGGVRETLVQVRVQLRDIGVLGPHDNNETVAIREPIPDGALETRGRHRPNAQREAHGRWRVLEMVVGAVRKSKSDIVLSTLAVSLYTE